jgi:hypothetical protein
MTRSASWPLLAAAATLALQVAVVVPATIYLANLVEFAATPVELLRILAVPALAATGVLFAVGVAAGPRVAHVVVAVCAALTLLAWLQGFILVWDYGPLDGSSIDWQRRPWRGLDLALWIGVLLAAVVYARRLHTALLTAAIAITVLQCVILAVGGVRQRDALAAVTQKFKPLAAPEGLGDMPRFSSERNVLHLVLDSFQSDIFAEIVAGGGERYRSALEGFVFYEQNLGVFPYTYFALPAILGGQIYRNDVPKREFIRSVFAGPTVLNAAHGAGYEVDIASEPLMLNMLMHGRYTGAYHVPDVVGGRAGAVLGDAATLLDLALFRVAPHVLKRLVHNDHRWIVPRPGRSAFQETSYFTHSSFLIRLAEEARADRPVPVYKFFHLMGPHAPMVAGEHCGYAGATLQRVRPTVLVQSRCTLDFAIDLLERMKTFGIYRDALIIIMGDHGGHIPPPGYEPEVGAMLPRVVGLATPLLLVKLPGATGPLRSSDLPTSSLDVAPTVDSALGLSAGLRGVPIAEVRAGARDRRFHFYDFQASDYVQDYVNPIHEYRITGSPYDPGAWADERVWPAPAAGTALP